LEKVFCYLLGVAKNYIMYWGGLQLLLYIFLFESVHKDYRIFAIFLCNPITLCDFIDIFHYNFDL
jgi:hypothetical protein